MSLLKRGIPPKPQPIKSSPFPPIPLPPTSDLLPPSLKKGLKGLRNPRSKSCFFLESKNVRFIIYHIKTYTYLSILFIHIFIPSSVHPHNPPTHTSTNLFIQSTVYPSTNHPLSMHLLAKHILNVCK